jgi:cytochrome b6-f complex iron-sulfur subunit
MADDTKVPPNEPPAPPDPSAPRDLTSATPREAPSPPAQPKTAEHVAPAASGAAPAPKAAAQGVAGAGSHAPKAPPKPPPPAVRPEVLAGKTTSVAAASAKPAAPARAADDTSPLMSRRGWIALAWGAFTAASAAALAATGRFMFPNVLNEPPQQFKAGFPSDYGPGVDERWKEQFGVWIVRTGDDVVHHAGGFYALLVTCTHLGCTPNWLAAEGKFKCPCHGSGFRPTGINFEGPAPRPLERARIVLAEDGQILVDKSRKFQYELGQWIDPEAFLRA